MRIRTVALGVVLLASPLEAGAGARTGRAEDPSRRALAFFERGEVQGVEAFLRRLRPRPLSEALRAAVIARLPPEGGLEPTPRERQKIASLDPVFALHDRTGLVTVKVIEVGHAFVGLHARSVLLLSRDALSLLPAGELQAVAAHELGHELFWDEYQEARARGAHGVMQELELRCDGVAVATLVRLGQDVETLVRAVRKMTRYNQARGATASTPHYVSLHERRRFIEAVAALHTRRDPPAASRRAP